MALAINRFPAQIPSREITKSLCQAKGYDSSARNDNKCASIISGRQNKLEKGVTVNRKRGYDEHVFSLEGFVMGLPQKRKKPIRLGPLSSATQENISDVKQNGGACWRCKMLKKPVSNSKEIFHKILLTI